jgi:hypothetical protein
MKRNKELKVFVVFWPKHLDIKGTILYVPHYYVVG